jgi:hypothetical protein
VYQVSISVTRLKSVQSHDDEIVESGSQHGSNQSGAPSVSDTDNPIASTPVVLPEWMANLAPEVIRRQVRFDNAEQSS